MSLLLAFVVLGCAAIAVGLTYWVISNWTKAPGWVADIMKLAIFLVLVFLFRGLFGV